MYQVYIHDGVLYRFCPSTGRMWRLIGGLWDRIVEHESSRT